MKFAKGIGLLVCFGWLPILAGCGGPSLGPMVPVQGKVTFNGTPLPDGDVQFVPLDENAKAPIASGNIEADGSYTLSTNGKPGAHVGKYRAVVNPGENKKAWLHVGAIYSNDKKSPLEIEVVENKPAGGYDLKLLPKGQARQ
jgi:hypothetical protein